MSQQKASSHRAFLAALAIRGNTLNNFAKENNVSNTAVSLVSRGIMKSSRISKAIRDYVEQTDFAVEVCDEN
jgi:lambda repressor-like predicted transcriptional regulator